MKKYLYLLTVIVTFSACHRNDFTVTGNVSDAEGKTLYFEATQIDKIVTLDSIKLKSDGKFTFYAPKTEFPEFYRLRLDSSYIHFAIDSTETVTFQTSGKSFTDYSVEGSEENKQIQEVSQAGSLLKNEVDKILSNTGTSDSIRIANAKRLLNALDQYKKTTLPIIYGNPKSKSAVLVVVRLEEKLWPYCKVAWLDVSLYNIHRTHLLRHGWLYCLLCRTDRKLCFR